MTTIDIQDSSDGTYIFTCTARASTPYGEGNATLFVPDAELPTLVARLQARLGGRHHDELHAALEPLVAVADHLSDARADTVLYRDGTVQLSVGDVQRLALTVARLGRAGVL